MRSRGNARGIHDNVGSWICGNHVLTHNMGAK